MSTKSTFVTPKSRHSDIIHERTKGSSKTPECFKPITLGTPISVTTKKVNGNRKESVSTLVDDLVDHKRPNEENTGITVAIRVRPLLPKELTDPKIKIAVEVEGNTITVEHGENRSSLSPYNFAFDHCFWSLDDKHSQFADQNRVYETVACQLLHNSFEGYNTCLFAYGQTGSGKSYSIMGPQTDQGIIPRFGKDLFDKIQSNIDTSEKWCVEISFFEIYNEKIHDLLASGPESNKKAAMRVREHPILGPYVEDLATFVVSCYDDFASWLSIGNKQRATAATGLNEKSSRSHSALTVIISRTKTEMVDEKPREHTRKSKVNIIDLAGSERVGAHVTVENRVKEGVCINKSLLTLGKVISQLAEMSTNNKKLFVPYRESVLTWLLKESLGGNSKTTMLATVSPTNLHVEETLSTLRYARQTRNIVNEARVNEDPDVHHIIRELQAEIEMLRKQKDLVTQEENKILREKLLESEMLLQKTMKTNEEKLDQANKRKAEEAELLQKAGIAFQVDSKLPRLINLNHDPQLTETLNYILQDGQTCVGSLFNTSEKQFIHLNGSLIEDQHCTIKNNGGTVLIIPNDNAQTYINGHQIKIETQLSHGDRIILGGQHYFRFIHPIENQTNLCHDDGKDYVYAQTEFLRVQDERIKEEITKEREKIRHEMLEEIESIKNECESVMNFQRQGFENHIEKLTTALDEKYQELEQANKQKNEFDLVNMRLRETNSNESCNDETLHNVHDLEPLQTDFLKQIEECLNSGVTVSKVRGPWSATSNGFGLYQLSIMIRKANCISKNFGMCLEFHQHDRLTDKLAFELTVKVRDVSKNKKLEWSIRKFVNKLEILRSLDSSQSDELFDSEDVWEDDEDCAVSFSPKIVESFLTAYESVENISLNMTELNGSPNNSKCIRNGLMWNKIQSQLKESSLLTKTPSPSKTQKLQEWHASHSTAIIDSFQAITESMSNGQEFEILIKELSCLHQIMYTLKLVNRNDCELTTNLTGSMTTILLMSTKIVTLFSLRANNHNNLSLKFKKEIECLCRTIVTIMQKVITDHDSCEQTTISDVMKKLSKCSLLAGKIVASLGICLTEDVKMESDLEKYFVGGLYCITLDALQTALMELEDLDLRLTMELENSCNEISKLKIDNSIVTDWHKILIKIREWTGSFKHFQEAASKENMSNQDVIGFKSSLSQKIILNFSSLIDNVSTICEAFSMYMTKDSGSKTKGIVLVNGVIKHIQQNMDSLTSVKNLNMSLVGHKTETNLQEAQKKFQRGLEDIRSSLTKFQKSLQGFISTRKGSVSSENHSKGNKTPNLESCSKNREHTPSRVVTPKRNVSLTKRIDSPLNGHDTFNSHTNGQSPSYTAITQESISPAGTSIWTTKSTISDSHTLCSSDCSDFTIKN